MKNFTRSILVCAMICMYFFSFSQTFSDTLSSPLAIPDNACATDSAEAVVVVSGIGTLGGTNKIIDEVCIDITHTWCGDIEISLISPNDTEILLMGDLGSQTDGMNICFDDAAAASVTTVPTADGIIITGSFRPLNALSTFNGESADGDWKITICDDAGGDTGTLDSWNITFADPPSCSAPTGVSSSNITNEAATINWTDGLGCSSVLIEYDTSGFTIGMGDQITPGCGVGTAGLTGLDSQTDYEYYMIQTCTTSAMDTVGPFSFTTLCDVFTTPSMEDFATFLPSCWNEAGDGTPATGPTGLGTGAWNVDGFGNVGTTGAARVNLFTTNQNEWLLTPQYDLTGGPYSAQFDIALTAFAGTGVENFGSDDQVQFLISDDGGATWTNLQTWDATTPVSNTGDFKVVDLAAYSGTVQFAFYATDGTTADAEDVDFFVDNFVIDVPPTCLNPTVSDTVRVTDCASPFSADIVIGTDGTGTMFTISDTIGTTSITNVLPGTVTNFGSYPIGTIVSIFITDEDDGTCIVERIVQVTDECPPDCPISLDLPIDGAIDVDLSVLLTWSAPSTGGQPTGYQVVFSDVNPPVDTLGGIFPDTLVTIFGLDFNTTYYWSIFSVNDGGESTGCIAANVNSFTTKSPPAGPVGVSCTTLGSDPGFVYSETFDAAAFPAGWAGDLGTGTTNQMWNVRTGATSSTGTGPDNASDGDYYMYYEATGADPMDSVYVTTDTIDLSTAVDAAELSFDLHMFGPFIGTLDVGVSTSSVGPWTSVFNWVGSIQQTSADIFITVGANMDAYVGQKVFLHFAATYGGGFQGDIAVDKIRIESCTNCSSASNIVTSAVSSDQAIITWEDGAGCADINIVFDTTGFLINTGMNINPGCGVETATITGLMAETTYDYYLISECGNGQIDTLGPFTFTTPCGVFTPPYLNTIENVPPDACWIEAGDGTPATGPSDLGTGLWFADGFGNVGTSGSAAINLYTTNRTDWLISPQFDLTGGPFSLIYDAALTAFGGPTDTMLGSDDQVLVLITIDSGATWQTLKTYDNASIVPAVGINETIDLTAYSNVVQFAFYGTDGAVNDPNDVNFYIDNFEIRDQTASPSCVVLSSPADDEIDVDEDADLTWPAAPSATGYRINMGTTTGATDILDGENVLNVTTYDPGTLQFSQEYFVTIIPYNDNGATFGCDESSFTVRDIPCGVEDAEVSAVSENSATLIWTDGAGCQNLDIEFGISPYVAGTNAGTNIGCGIETALISGLSANTTYDVLIISTCASENDTTSLTFTTDCSSISVPYCDDFDDVTLTNCWTIDDVTLDGDTWAFESTGNARSGSTAAVATWDGTNPKDDWLFSPAFIMTGGTEYTISFAFRVLGSSFPESLELLAGQGTTPVDMNTTIFSMIDFNHTKYVLAVAHFTPATSGDYNLGFHAISSPDQFDLLMDDFCITECASSMVMNSDSVGTGSLMDVIMNQCGSDVIMFDAATDGDTIPFTGVMLNSPMTIMGNGSGLTTLSGSGNDRLFWIRPGVGVTLKGMSLINSNTSQDGGALVNEGNLNLENVILSGNTENSNPKSMTIKPGSTTTVDGTVEAKE